MHSRGPGGLPGGKTVGRRCAQPSFDTPQCFLPWCRGGWSSCVEDKSLTQMICQGHHAKEDAFSIDFFEQAWWFQFLQRKAFELPLAIWPLHLKQAISSSGRLPLLPTRERCRPQAQRWKSRHPSRFLHEKRDWLWEPVQKKALPRPKMAPSRHCHSHVPSQHWH